MEVKVSKCTTASYILSEEKRSTYLDKFFLFRGDAIPNLTTADSMAYLGTPVAVRKTIKLQAAKLKLKEMEVLLGKIVSSPLLKFQEIDEVKIVLPPSIDCLPFNEEVGAD
jgi:hypothetical protein